MTNKTNLALAALVPILFSYIIVVSINVLNPPQVYRPQVLSETVTTSPSPSSAPISVNIQNTKLMASSQTLYETDVSIKTTASVSAGFWYQGPNNPYGTSVFEDKTVALKKDHTFHITALPVGTYEYFAVSFDNQNQKPPFVRYPETGTELMYVGVTPPPEASKSTSVALINNVKVSDIKSDGLFSNAYKAVLTFTTTAELNSTVYLYGPAYSDGIAISNSTSEPTKGHSYNLSGLYKGTYEYYLLAGSTRYPPTGFADFEVK